MSKGLKGGKEGGREGGEEEDNIVVPTLP